MNRQEIMVTRYGEMLDMITCLLIYEGRISPKEQTRELSYEEIKKLR